MMVAVKELVGCITTRNQAKPMIELFQELEIELELVGMLWTMKNGGAATLLGIMRKNMSCQ